MTDSCRRHPRPQTLQPRPQRLLSPSHLGVFPLDIFAHTSHQLFNFENEASDARQIARHHDRTRAVKRGKYELKSSLEGSFTIYKIQVGRPESSFVTARSTITYPVQYIDETLATAVGVEKVTSLMTVNAKWVSQPFPRAFQLALLGNINPM